MALTYTGDAIFGSITEFGDLVIDELTITGEYASSSFVYFELEASSISSGNIELDANSKIVITANSLSSSIISSISNNSVNLDTLFSTSISNARITLAALLGLLKASSTSSSFVELSPSMASFTLSATSTSNSTISDFWDNSVVLGLLLAVSLSSSYIILSTGILIRYEPLTEKGFSVFGGLTEFGEDVFFNNTDLTTTAELVSYESITGDKLKAESKSNTVFKLFYKNYNPTYINLENISAKIVIIEIPVRDEGISIINFNSTIIDIEV